MSGRPPEVAMPCVDSALAQLGQQRRRARQRRGARAAARGTARRGASAALGVLAGELVAELARDGAGEQAAAHADPAVDAPAVDRHPALGERPLPGEDVRVDGVDERAVEIEHEGRHRGRHSGPRWAGSDTPRGRRIPVGPGLRGAGRRADGLQMASAPAATDHAASTNGRARTPTRGPLLAGDDAVPRGLAVTSAIALRLLIVAGAIYLVGIAAGGLLLLVLPVVIALLLTTLLTPPANWLRRHRFRPAAASGTMVLLTALFVLGLIGLIVRPSSRSSQTSAATCARGPRRRPDCWPRWASIGPTCRAP